jgi:hypothetical protein
LLNGGQAKDWADANGLSKSWVCRIQARAMARPCPFVSCKHNLYLDVNPETGAVKMNFPDLDPDQMSESCALDVADRGYATLEEVGKAMNFTRERTRQVEVLALRKVAEATDLPILRDGVTNCELGDGTGEDGARKLGIDDFELDRADVDESEVVA